MVRAVAGICLIALTMLRATALCLRASPSASRWVQMSTSAAIGPNKVNVFKIENA